MERWKKAVLAGLILVYVVIPAIYFLPVVEGSSMQPSDVIDCWKLNIQYWLGEKKIWKPSREYVIENYNPYRAQIILSHDWYTDGELFYHKGKLGLMFLRVKWGEVLDQVCGSIHVVEKVGEGKYRVTAYVPKVEMVYRYPAVTYSVRECFIKKSEELKFSVVVRGFEIPLDMKRNESLHRFLMKIQPAPNLNNRPDNLTMLNSKGEVVLSRPFYYGVMRFSPEDSRIIRKLADEVRHYAEELHYNRTQTLILALLAGSVRGPYNMNINNFNASYILKIPVYEGNRTRTARIVAESYIGNSIINGGVCEDAAIFDTALLRSLGFDAYVFGYSKHRNPQDGHAEMVINPEGLNLNFRKIFNHDPRYTVLRVNINGTEKELIDPWVAPIIIIDNFGKNPDFEIYSVEIE
ncbi:hypothetical protein Ferp_0487 [Ferroglobus placidus DSM 10642]|uniref:Uncharacterized protein n=1 Tax=Ferroglobus placidus (strain DSM 10642 / AEDII12DO) TaxID=589924 RepID=D3S328_FERPA|nr:hypothetical protein [Ferroglobus placidus]ADC64661.1 hypothetical protein Ferp_0487 [Ferroglobus placidus DSM 10642]